jgi:ATP-dependent Clp protease adaptor protein ClpS
MKFLIAGDKYFGLKYNKDRSVVLTVVASGKSGGVLDRPPTIEKTTPGRESEFNLRYSNLYY